MAPTGNVIDGINRERLELAEIKEMADRVIDTSDMTVHQLREEIKKIFESVRSDVLKIVVTSFGYGRGVPMESDVVLDVRFLPNPYFVEELKNLDGRNFEVSSWVLSHEVTTKFWKSLRTCWFFFCPFTYEKGSSTLPFP